VIYGQRHPSGRKTTPPSQQRKSSGGQFTVQGCTGNVARPSGPSSHQRRPRRASADDWHCKGDMLLPRLLGQRRWPSAVLDWPGRRGAARCRLGTSRHTAVIADPIRVAGSRISAVAVVSSSETLRTAESSQSRVSVSGARDGRFPPRGDWRQPAIAPPGLDRPEPAGRDARQQRASRRRHASPIYSVLPHLAPSSCCRSTETATAAAPRQRARNHPQEGHHRLPLAQCCTRFLGARTGSRGSSKASPIVSGPSCRTVTCVLPPHADAGPGRRGALFVAGGAATSATFRRLDGQGLRGRCCTVTGPGRQEMAGIEWSGSNGSAASRHAAARLSRIVGAWSGSA